MLETDDRVRGIILRYPGNPDHEFCMKDDNSLRYGKGNKTYRFPCAPITHHLVRMDRLFMWHIVWMSQGYKYGRKPDQRFIW